MSSPLFASVSPSGSRLVGAIRLPVRREQRRRREERDVAVVEMTVGEVDTQRVEPRRVDLALVVRQAVEDVRPGVVGDAGEAADRRAGEGRPGRDDRLSRGTPGPEQTMSGDGSACATLTGNAIDTTLKTSATTTSRLNNVRFVMVQCPF